MKQAEGWQESLSGDGDLFAVALTGLLSRIRGSCVGGGEWPESVGQGLRAALSFLVEESRLANALFDAPGSSSFGEPYLLLVSKISALLEEVVPVEAKPGPDTPAAAIAGIGLLVGDHIRAGRVDQLADLAPEMHLLILLPFLRFEEARSSVEMFGPSELT